MTAPAAQSITARDGKLSSRALAVLTTLETPKRNPDVAALLGWDTSLSWSWIKHLLEMGYVQRISKGYFQKTSKLEATNALIQTGANRRNAVYQSPPPGNKGDPITGERQIWLERAYAAAGYAHCGKLLGVNKHTVWYKAKQLGLQGGDIAGRITLSDLVELLQCEYSPLYMRAKRVGVLKLTLSGRHANVPMAWADLIASEYGRPTRDEISLKAVALEYNIPHTTVNRLLRPVAQFRRKFGQPQLYVPREAAERMARKHKPQTVRLGLEGMLERLREYPDGVTVSALARVAGVTEMCVRLYITRLRGDGKIVTVKPSSCEAMVIKLAGLEAA